MTRGLTRMRLDRSMATRRNQIFHSLLKMDQYPNRITDLKSLISEANATCNGRLDESKKY